MRSTVLDQLCMSSIVQPLYFYQKARGSTEEAPLIRLCTRVQGELLKKADPEVTQHDGIETFFKKSRIWDGQVLRFRPSDLNKCMG